MFNNRPRCDAVIVDMEPCLEMLATILKDPSDLEFVLGWAIDDATRYVDRLDDLELGLESIASTTREMLFDADNENNPEWIETVARARVATARYLHDVFRGSNLYDEAGFLPSLEYAYLRGSNRYDAVFVAPPQ